VLLVLVYVGSEGLRWFDAALAGYLMGTLLATFAVAYRYVVWIDRPPTRALRRRGWQAFWGRGRRLRGLVHLPDVFWRHLVGQGFVLRRSTLVEGVTADRVGAAALSLALTSGLMVWLQRPHPPAGATTLIVSLGILREPWQLAVLMVAVVLMVVQGFVINRAAGLPYPLWAPVEGRGAAGEAA
jgi:hypothetical protein